MYCSSGCMCLYGVISALLCAFFCMKRSPMFCGVRSVSLGLSMEFSSAVLLPRDPLSCAHAASDAPSVTSSSLALPHPFTSWSTPLATRTLIARLLPDLLSVSIKGLEDWKAGVRRSAAGQLRSLLLVAQDLIIPHIQPVFVALSRASR